MEKTDASVSKHQAPVERIHRRDITMVEWNPRKITAEAKAKLQANIKKIGLAHTLTFNRRTGNLVSGHQRLAIMDSLERSADYLLDVSVVDLTEKEEREQNVLMNNALAQGTWDADGFEELLAGLGGDLDLAALGFDGFDDLKAVIGRLDFIGADALGIEESAESKRMADELAAMAPVKNEPGSPEHLAAKAALATVARDARAKAKGDGNGESEMWCVLVFKDRATRNSFVGWIGGGKEERYIDGRLAMAAAGMTDATQAASSVEGA